MKPFLDRICCLVPAPGSLARLVLILILLLICRPAHSQDSTNAWQHEQHFDVPAPGLIKLSLPVETLDLARPVLEDLRLYDDAGHELPYLIEHPAPAPKISRSARTFQASLNSSATVLTLETGLTQPLDSVTLETPAPSFIKSVQIDGSADGKNWRTLSQGQPIFRQPDGASQLRVAVPPGTWAWLRLTVDDSRSPPVPFTGASLQAASGASAPSEELPVSIVERHENPGETRLTLNLGAANLSLAAIRLETPEPLFIRPVTLAMPQVGEGSVLERTFAQGVIYRVAVEGQPVSAHLAVHFDSQIPSRELLLLIRNQDSPPLSITAVRGERRPVYLVFFARAAGRHHLLTGNSRCAAPRYDLAALGASLRTAVVSPISISPPADNPGYHPPEVLPGIQEEGATLDVSAWKFRKPLQLTRGGAQEIELDLDVLSRALPGLQDLRLLRHGKQLPYILERTSISRSLAPVVSVAADAKDPGLSRWVLKLPRPALPVTRLSCATRTQVWQRDVTLGEEVADERGEKERRVLATASWVRAPGHASQELVLRIDTRPETDTLFLETHNGDNPPVELENFGVFYPATRLLFKANGEDGAFLYYGNPRAESPRYDLSLVAGELLDAKRAPAKLGSEEQLKKSSWGEGRVSSQGGGVFWGVLALVVALLLAIISRLLPKSIPSPK